MDKLKEQTCEACRVGAPQVTDEEIKILRGEIPEWDLVKEEGISKLQRIFVFGNFIDALNFTHRVGVEAVV